MSDRWVDYRKEHSGVVWSQFLLPFFTAPLSFFSSVYVIYLILKQRRTTLHLPREQILLGLSLLDMFFSFGLSFSTTPGPAVMDQILPTYGTVATCNAQGFFVQLGLGAPMYNACLCVYYLLSIRYKVSDRYLIEWVIPCMHAFILTFSTATAVAGIMLKLFNYAGVMGCWIHNADVLCGKEPKHCDRGQRADDFLIYFGLIHLGMCFVFVVLSMLFLAISVRAIELRSRRWEFNGGRDNNSNKSMPLTRRTIETGALYSAAFVAIWLPSVLLGTVIGSSSATPTRRALQVLSAALQPLQGFFNMIIYTSPNWLKWYKKLNCFRRDDGTLFFRRKKTDTSLDENEDDEEAHDTEGELSMDLFSVKDVIDDRLSREFTPMAQRRSARLLSGRSSFRENRRASLGQPGDHALLSSTFLHAELETLQEMSREGSSVASVRHSSVEEISETLRRSSLDEIRYEAGTSSLSFHRGEVPPRIAESSDDDHSENSGPTEIEGERVGADLDNGIKAEIDADDSTLDASGKTWSQKAGDESGRRSTQTSIQGGWSSKAVDSRLDSSSMLEFPSSSECTEHA